MKKLRSDDKKFWGLVVIGTVFAAAGFIAPPLGQLDPSILIWAGECLVLAGAVLGINLNFDLKQILHLKDNKDKDEEVNNEQ